MKFIVMAFFLTGCDGRPMSEIEADRQHAGRVESLRNGVSTIAEPSNANFGNSGQ